MIRQAHTYLVGALSGVVVIGIAIAAFVVLVSAQVFHDLPIPALSSSDQKAAVSQNKALSSPNTGAVATTGGVGTSQTSQGNTNPNPSGGPNGPTGAATPGDGQRHQANAGTPADDATGPAEVVETAPTTTTTSTGGNEGPSTSGGDKTGGSKDSQPSSGTKSTSPSSPGSVGGNSSSGTSGNSGSSGGSPTTTSGSSGGAPSTGTSGGGSTTTSPPATPVTTAKPSETITETVNGTVGTVDEALGGTLSESGVSKVTEEVVNGVAGPESVVGKTVDGVGEVVGGLVGGNGQ
jgi:hypothetical protein